MATTVERGIGRAAHVSAEIKKRMRVGTGLRNLAERRTMT
jgi:hypothetical protein